MSYKVSTAWISLAHLKLETYEALRKDPTLGGAVSSCRPYKEGWFMACQRWYDSRMPQDLLKITGFCLRNKCKFLLLEPAHGSILRDELPVYDWFSFNEFYEEPDSADPIWWP